MHFSLKMMIETALEFLLPSLWEIEFTAAAAVFIIVSYWYFYFVVGEIDDGGDRAFGDNSLGFRDGIDDKKDKIGQRHAADEYEGLVRELKFRSVCKSPMCPPDTAVTEWQHVVISPDKRIVVFETVQQAHDVPFGSYFEVHCRWQIETNTEPSYNIDIKASAHFKKWCVMQGKIRSGAVDE